MILNMSYNRQLKKHDKEVICMPKFYIKWLLEPTLWPAMVEEMVKLVCSLSQMVKADMEADLIKD
jgi:hypothetical protein